MGNLWNNKHVLFGTTLVVGVLELIGVVQTIGVVRVGVWTVGLATAMRLYWLLIRSDKELQAERERRRLSLALDIITFAFAPYGGGLYGASGETWGFIWIAVLNTGELPSVAWGWSVTISPPVGPDVKAEIINISGEPIETIDQSTGQQIVIDQSNYIYNRTELQPIAGGGLERGVLVVKVHGLTMGQVSVAGTKVVVKCVDVLKRPYVAQLVATRRNDRPWHYAGM
jgi:hypothetical protein